MDKIEANIIDWLNDIVKDEEKWNMFYSSSEVRLLAKDTLKLIDQKDETICAFAELLIKYGYKFEKEVLNKINKYEAVKPRSISRHGPYARIDHFCGNCNALLLHRKQNFCQDCGRKVKW